MQTVAAFTVFAAGEDSKFDGARSSFVPSSSKMMKRAASELSVGVQKRLYEQGFLKSLNVQAPASNSNDAIRPAYTDDTSKLKVWK